MTSQVLLSEKACRLVPLLNLLAAYAAVFRVARVSRMACNTCLDTQVRQGLRNDHTPGVHSYQVSAILVTCDCVVLYCVAIAVGCVHRNACVSLEQ